MKDIVIIGAGGVGKETSWIIEQINNVNKKWNLLGIIDENKDIWNSKINGYKVLGGFEYLDKYKKSENKPYIIVAIANYAVKKRMVDKIKDEFEFATIIHPDVFIHESISIGQGCIIYPGVIMTANINIGNHVIISPKCGIGHDSIINDYASLLWNVNVSGHDVIGEGVLIGSGATIIQGKKVGSGAIVGAGAVVINDVEDETTNVGVPACVIKN